MKNLFAIIFLIATTFSSAQNKVVNDIIVHHQKVKRIEGVFKEEKNMPQLKKPLLSTGIFYIDQDKMRWEQEMPVSHIIVINGEELAVKDKGKIERYNLKNNRKMKMMRKIMTKLSDGSYLNDKDFERKMIKHDDYWEFHLTPKVKAMKNFIQEIQLTFDKHSKNLTTFTIVENASVSTKVYLTVNQQNHAIDDSKFELK